MDVATTPHCGGPDKLQQLTESPAQVSNCLFFVLAKLWRRGGYLIIRKSHFGWWPHFIWSPDLVEFQEFTPPVHYPVILPPILFKGVTLITTADQQVLTKPRP